MLGEVSTGLGAMQSIKRSEAHKFLPEDFKAIDRALNDLGGRGNRASWSYLEKVYPGDLLFRRLVGDYSENTNAVDDLGSDSPDRARVEYWSYKRDSNVRDAVLKRAQGTCEYCSAFGFLKADGTRYLETHHVIALAK